MSVLQFLALLCFAVAAILAGLSTRWTRGGDLWGALVALGLFLWLLSDSKVIS
jgi:uncharacterized membrane protein YoaK (UPF0700 family)